MKMLRILRDEICNAVCFPVYCPHKGNPETCLIHELEAIRSSDHLSKDSGTGSGTGENCRRSGDRRSTGPAQA